MERDMKKALAFAVLSVAFLGMTACGPKNVDTTKDLYLRFLGGDMTVLVESQRDWFIPDFTGDDVVYEYTFSDLDGDDEDEMIVQMYDNPGGFSAAFTIESNKVVCWYSDSVEQTSYNYPLDNGLMVNEYDYGGSVSYHILKFTEDGENQIVSNLFMREHLDFEDDTRKCPQYLIDDEDVDKDTFEQELKAKILDHVLERSDWKVIGE